MGRIINNLDETEIVLTMDWLGHKWNVTISSRTFMILALVVLLFFPIGFSVYNRSINRLFKGPLNIS